MIGVDLMIFDFDGTLADTREDIIKAVNYTLRALGLPEKPEAEIAGFIGDGSRKLIERSLQFGYSAGHPEKMDEAMAVFLKYYGEHLLDSTGLYPGVVEVLEHFGEKKKWIVTNKLYEFTAEIARRLGIGDYFDGIIGRDSSPYPKPDSRVVWGISERYGIRRERTVVIGDGVHDIRMAKNAGVWGCACLYGLSGRDELLREHPDFSCESILELKTLFC